MFPEHFSFNKLLDSLLELRTCLAPGISYMFYEAATKERSFFVQSACCVKIAVSATLKNWLFSSLRLNKNVYLVVSDHTSHNNVYIFSFSTSLTVWTGSLLFGDFLGLTRD